MMLWECWDGSEVQLWQNGSKFDEDVVNSEHLRKLKNARVNMALRVKATWGVT